MVCIDGKYFAVTLIFALKREELDLKARTTIKLAENEDAHRTTTDFCGFDANFQLFNSSVGKLDLNPPLVPQVRTTEKCCHRSISSVGNSSRTYRWPKYGKMKVIMLSTYHITNEYDCILKIGFSSSSSLDCASAQTSFWIPRLKVLAPGIQFNSIFERLMRWENSLGDSLFL